jgi:hypothetical protein
LAAGGWFFDCHSESSEESQEIIRDVSLRST